MAAARFVNDKQATAQAAARCELGDWRRATANNTILRRAIFIDAWPGTGMGHVLMANAMALRFVSLIEPARAVRFTPCLPHVTKAVIDAQIKNNKARGGFDQIPRCNEPQFDVHRHLTFAGLPLQADARDLRRPGASQVFIRPTCEEMIFALRSPLQVVKFYFPHVKLIKRCAKRLLEERLVQRGWTARAVSKAVSSPLRAASSNGMLDDCMRLASPADGATWQHISAPPCNVGLHVRTLAMDDERCNFFRERDTFNDDDGDSGCPFSHRRPIDFGVGCCIKNPCTAASLVTGCPGDKFATADAPVAYALTRQHGWSDLNESATKTWLTISEQPRYGLDPAAAAPAQQAQESTVAAWWALANCRRAIVAPIRSAFSDAAAIAAGVPVKRCCKAVMGHDNEAIALAARRPPRTYTNSSCKRRDLLTVRVPGRRRSERRCHPWMSVARSGYCEKTVDGYAGDCENGNKGSWSLSAHEARTWGHAAAACVERCAGCSRCRYVSLSVNMLDCSWFNSCDELKTDVSGFRTAAVEPAMVAFGRTITPARERPSSSSK